MLSYLTGSATETTLMLIKCVPKAFHGVEVLRVHGSLGCLPSRAASDPSILSRFCIGKAKGENNFKSRREGISQEEHILSFLFNT